MATQVSLGEQFADREVNDPVYESEVLARLRPHLSEIAAAAPAGEQNRRLAPEVVETLRNAGLFRMMFPKVMGGSELSMAQGCRIMEELAMADGAAGWTALVSYGTQVTISRMAPELVKTIVAKGPDLLLRGGLAPTGKAIETEGGYIISGRWPFASGPFNPDWVVGGCIIHRDGAPVMGPDGRPESIVMLAPGDKVRFIDNWDVVGMKGTNSCDFEIDEMFLPSSHATPMRAWFDVSWPSSIDTPLFKLSFIISVMPTHSAVIIGLARGAFSELLKLAKTKRRAFSAVTLAEDPVFQDKIGEVSSRLAGLQALQDNMVTEACYLVENGGALSNDLMPRFGSWVAYINLECVRLINDCFTLAGSTPVYNTSRIQQYWRDARVAAQHFGSSPVSFQNYGKLLVNSGAQGSA